MMSQKATSWSMVMTSQIGVTATATLAHSALHKRKQTNAISLVPSIHRYFKHSSSCQKMSNHCEQSERCKAALQVMMPSSYESAKDTTIKSPMLNLPTRVESTSAPLSASIVKETSPTSVVRPTVRRAIATTWVSLPPIDQDLMPRRKLSLGLYFNANDEEDEEFWLVPPQRINRAVSRTTRVMPPPLPFCEDGILTSPMSTSEPFRLQRRASPVSNPFSSANHHVTHHQSDGSPVGSVAQDNTTIPPTPPPRSVSPLSPPPPCRNEDVIPLDRVVNGPDKLYLPLF